MAYVIGIDGGGTRTTLALVDERNREVLRRRGSASRVDPRDPAASTAVLGAMVRAAVAEAGLTEPAAAVCAGLAGAGSEIEREAVREALCGMGLAERVVVLSDGEIALHGAFGSAPGILVISGTGSIAFGRGEDGRVERCGGWGEIVGDDGSGYAIGRAALRAVLRAADGRGESTRLLDELPHVLALSGPFRIPPWAGRAEKAEIAALAVHVVDIAERGDAVAERILRQAAGELARHATALHQRLQPWASPPVLSLGGGMMRQPTFAAWVRDALPGEPRFTHMEAAADAVQGAISLAWEAARSLRPVV